ncbi:MAG: hypothetical protein JSU90_10660 [Nitrospiraceae bacterium]|nr:MAG: hypothetical protein JSU90_10660 [Nitrospiraceae bacterium]
MPLLQGYARENSPYHYSPGKEIRPGAIGYREELLSPGTAVERNGRQADDVYW